MPATRKSVQASIGAALRAERVRRGMTQEQVAHGAGLSLNYVSELERGKRNPSVVTLFQLANALGVGPEALVRRANKAL